MDPVTLSLLIAGGLGTTQGVISSFQNNAEQKRNREQLDELLAAEKSGKMGLTGAEQQQMSNELVSPIQSATTAMRTRAEQAQAAMGNTSGANLARLREEQTRAVSGAQQAAAGQVQAADLAAQQRQRNELEQRLALKSAMRRDDVNAILGGVSAVAGPLGGLAGAPPGTNQLSGMFGQAFTGAEKSQLADFNAQNPGVIDDIVNEILSGSATGNGSTAAGVV
jgi:hypothetical protein